MRCRSYKINTATAVGERAARCVVKGEKIFPNNGTGSANQRRDMYRSRTENRAAVISVDVCVCVYIYTYIIMADNDCRMLIFK
jgi:hypothetical protein